MKAWQVVRKGAPSKALELRDIDVPEPGPGQIRTRVDATVCNLNEVDGCYGRYKTVDPPLPYTLGMEAVGLVDAVGEGAEAWLGRRVMMTGVGATGAHAEWVIGDQTMVFECPDALDDHSAAAFYFPFHVAYVSLVERGKLTAGETVLVHGGAGGVGSAAVQLAKALGARVIATAGSPEKLEFCRSIGADVAINYTTGDWTEAVAEATENRGIDVACDLVGGEVTNQTMRVMAYGGRLMLTGFSGGIEAEDEAGLLPRPIIFGNISVSGVLLAYGDPNAFGLAGIHLVPRERGEAIHAHLLALHGAGAIRPLIHDVTPYTELPLALERMERRETMGRSVIRWGADVS